MPRKLLVTQCLQNDFVDPIGKYDALPNLLHIGYSEALRLMGEVPSEGPVAQVMNWAYAQDEKNLGIVHIRDWHDAADERQKTHLDYFGTHCVRGTTGADFAFNVPNDRRVTLVDALTLNDFIDSNLAEALEPYKNEAVDVGLIGVWTEAKITFLAYELATRFPNFNLAVCSALTASSSRSQHFIALNQLEKVLGLKIYDSVGDFVQFLGAQMAAYVPVLRKSADSQDLKIEAAGKVDKEAESLLRYLFRDCRSVHLKSLDGGFSGNLVLGSKSVDNYGHSQVPHVVKIGPRKLIASERTAFEKIESVLGNNAPRIVEFADLENLGAIKYRYASMGGAARSFQKMYSSDAKPSEIKNVLTEVFQDQLGRLYSAAELESCNLLKYYCFRPDLAERVRGLALGAGGSQEEADRLALFYSEHLPALMNEPEYRYFAHVHGDLNGANIIVDAHDNVWLIDFFHAHRGHILKDLVKLENDILYIYTAVRSASELKHATAFSEQLLDIDDLWQAPAFKASELKLPQFKRAADVIRHLRSFYKPLIQADRDVYQLMVAQLRYAVHTLSFDESKPLQKKWALHTALSITNKIIERAQTTRQLRIDWVNFANVDRQIGLTILPGRKDRQRDLNQDIHALKASGITEVVCLATPTELKNYGVGDLMQRYAKEGLTARALSIPDGKAPQTKALKELLVAVDASVKAGRKVLLHCVGGLGRSGLVAACYLKSKGLSAEEAIALVRKQRSQRAIETAAQEKFVRGFR